MMKAVLVTTEYRGVFFGYLSDDQDEKASSLILIDCRNVIYWSGKNGFLGLAVTGPDDNSTIGSRADRVLLHKVTSVADCYLAAVKAFKKC